MGDDMDDPSELYHHAKLAQQEAERAGFVLTATALGIFAESVLLGAEVDPAVILRLAGEGAAPAGWLPS